MRVSEPGHQIWYDCVCRELETKSACNSCRVIYEQHLAIKKPPPPALASQPQLLLRCDYDALVLSTGYVVERALEMFPRVLEAGCILVGLQIGVDEFDKSVQVLGCDLQGVSTLWVRLVVGGGGLQHRSLGRSNRHSGSESQRKARPRLRRPCTHRRRGEHAASTRAHACHRGRAAGVSLDRI